MVMRLVPRDELLGDDDEEIQALEEQALQAEQQARRGHVTDAGERQDGPVQDVAEDAVEDGADDAPREAGEGAAGEAAAAPEVNLALLEALLLGTHHPLTAGRLAELLELESTKPLRKAVKALNEQYEAGGRAFR